MMRGQGRAGNTRPLQQVLLARPWMNGGDRKDRRWPREVLKNASAGLQGCP